MFEVFSKAREQVRDTTAEFGVGAVETVAAYEVVDDGLDEVWIELKEAVVASDVLEVLKLDYAVRTLDKIASDSRLKHFTEIVAFRAARCKVVTLIALKKRYIK